MYGGGSEIKHANLCLVSLLRLLLGVVIAGMWPGMSYYLTLYYPPSRCATRIGHYYTAAQVSAAVVGLVSAGFQKMDGLGGLVGFQWMFLIYGLLAVILGFVLLWWLPPRPVVPGTEQGGKVRTGWRRLLPRSPPALTGEDAQVHYMEMSSVYRRPAWGWKDLGRVLIDWRIWPLVMMYFGVVGVGEFSPCESHCFGQYKTGKNIPLTSHAENRHRSPILRHSHHPLHQPLSVKYKPLPPLRPNLDHGLDSHPPHHASERQIPPPTPRLLHLPGLDNHR